MCNQTFSETIVPMEHYCKDQRVQSLIIEINRWFYLAEDFLVDLEGLEILVEILRRVAERRAKN